MTYLRPNKKNSQEAPGIHDELMLRRSPLANAIPSSRFETTRDPARPGFVRRFLAALVETRMRQAEAHVRRARARHSEHERAMVAELERLAPKAGSLPFGS